MRFAKFYFILFSLGLCFYGNTQKSNFQNFKLEVNIAKKDSLVSIFESKIAFLKTHKASDIEIVKYLQFQMDLADSLPNKELTDIAVLELINYPNLLTKRDLFYNLLNAGSIQNKLGNQDVGMELQFQALKIAEEIENDTIKAIGYKRVGINFKKVKNVELSKKYLRKAIKVNVKLNDTVQLASTYMTLGNTFKLIAQYDSALFSFNKSIDLAVLLGKKKDHCRKLQ